MSDLFADLADVIDALTNPRQESTPRWTWSPDRRDRNKKSLPPHVVRLPGLVTQVRALAYPLAVDGEDGDGARSVPQSREPGNPRALVAYLDVHWEVTRWQRHLDAHARPRLDSAIRSLLGRITGRPHHDLRDLLCDARGWLHRCEDVLGLAERDPVLTVPCPDCAHRTLHVDLDEHTVRCLACRARWTRDGGDGIGTLSVLARVVVAYRTRSAEAADEAWAAERRRKEQRWGRAGAPGKSS